VETGLAGKRVLVTGGAGGIGSNLVRALASDGARAWLSRGLAEALLGNPNGGAAAVWDRRGLTVAAARLLSGPGNLCRGLAIGGADNGADLCQGGRLCLEGAPDAPPLSSGPRVGISRAAERQLRFWWAGHPAVSAASRAGTKKGTGAEAGPEKSADLSRPPGA